MKKRGQDWAAETAPEEFHQWAQVKRKKERLAAALKKVEREVREASEALGLRLATELGLQPGDQLRVGTGRTYRVKAFAWKSTHSELRIICNQVEISGNVSRRVKALTPDGEGEVGYFGWTRLPRHVVRPWVSDGEDVISFESLQELVSTSVWSPVPQGWGYYQWQPDGRRWYLKLISDHETEASATAAMWEGARTVNYRL